MPKVAKDKHRELGPSFKTSVRLDSGWRIYVLSLAGGDALSNGIRNCIRKAYQLDLEKGTLPVEFLADYTLLHASIKADLRKYFLDHAGSLPNEAVRYDPNVLEAKLNAMDETPNQPEADDWGDINWGDD